MRAPLRPCPNASRRAAAALAAVLVAAGLVLALGAAPAQAAPGWYNSSWGYRKSITIDHTKVTATQTSFPVMISLASDSDLAAHAQSSGNDILFTSSDGVTKLNHEIESYTSATGALVAWVKVPTVSSSSDTVLYMYYGNASASNQQNATGTWDSNYSAVWHLTDGTTLSLADSTSNARTGTNHSATATTGAFDGGASFSSGSSQYVGLPSATLPGANNFTVSLWFKTSSNGVLFSEQSTAIGTTGGSHDPILYVDTNGKLHGGSYVGAIPTLLSASAVNDNNWHFAVLVVNASSTTQTLYLDGSSVGSYSGGPEGPLTTVSLGAGDTSGWPNTNNSTWYYTGRMDDVRVSSSATARSSTWISTEYNNQSSPSTFVTVGSAESRPPTGWISLSWGYRQAITIDHTKVTATQTNFPVLINLSSNTGLAAHAQSSGNDILFTSSDGVTQLNHEIEKYTSGTGALIAWVQVPTLSSTSDTTIYMYYGNAGATNQQNVPGTWDSSFAGVWHVPNGSTLSLADSTSQGNAGTNTGVTATSGQIDGGASFDGANHSFSTPTSGMPAINGSLTMSGWFYVPSAAGFGSRDIEAIYSSGGSADQLRITSGGNLQVSEWGGGTAVTGTHSITTNAWHYAVFTYNGSTATLYLDGASDNSASVTLQTGSATNFYVGTYGAQGGGEYWNGSLDELRISTTPRSSTWVSTEYNDQKTPSTFYSVGSETVPDTTPPSAFSITSPSAGTLVTNGQSISSSPTDNVAISSVSYRYCAGASCTWASGTDIGSTSSGPPYSVTWSSQPANGTYTLIARATDMSGNTTDSSTTTVLTNNGVGVDTPGSGAGAGVTSVSFSYTVGSNANRILLVGIETELGTGNTSACWISNGYPTYNGVAMTKVSSVQVGINCGALYYLVNPPSGSYTVQVNFGTTIEAAVGAVSLYNAKQAAPDATVSSSNASGATSTSVTTIAPNSLVVDAFASGQPLGDLAPSAGQTAQVQRDSGGSSSLGMSTKSLASPGSTTLGWTQTGINRSAQVVAAFAPISPCNGGSLNMTVASSISFPTVTLNGTNQTPSATLAVSPDDETASNAGWNITGTSTTFSTAGHSLLTTATSLTGVTSSAPVGNCTLPTDSIGYPVTLPAGASPPTAVKLYNAAVATGTGPTNLTLSFAVSVPANTFAGSYSSTWTFAIVSGP